MNQSQDKIVIDIIKEKININHQKYVLNIKYYDYNKSGCIEF